MRILVQTPADFDATPWIAGLRRDFPDAAVRRWASGDDAPADYALVWKTPAEFYAAPRGLRAVFALGAGVDALLPVTPPELPLLRLDDAGMAGQMAAYVVRAIFTAGPGIPSGLGWAAARAACLREAEAGMSVGVAGLGVLGAHVATTLSGLGFEVHGWSRTPKTLPGVTCHSGPAGLDTMLGVSRVLVNLLPLTPETENFIDARVFEKLPAGAHFINVARGAQVVDDALIAALDSGRLSRATLDVFRTEPLPESHPFWHHPKITITPHISARTLTGPALKNIVEKIRAIESGARSESLPGFVDRVRGY